jgi:carbamoyltransferase
MNLLSIHNGHDGAITVIKNNSLFFHTAIDRYTRVKHFTFPPITLIKKLKELDLFFDHIILTHHNYNNYTQYIELFKRFKLADNNTKFINYDNKLHHFFHNLVAKFFFKKESLCLVADGGGTDLELETLFDVNDDVVIKNFSNENYIGIGQAYTQLSNHLFGFECSEGKTMALSSYGNYSKTLHKKIISNKNFNHSFFNTHHVAYSRKMFKLSIRKEDNYSQDLIKTFQIICEKRIHNLIKKYNSKNLLFTGGVAQNVLINTYLKNKINNFEACPLNKDDSISLGSALYFLKMNVKPIENLYIGVEQDLDLNLFNEYKIKNTTEEEVCSILKNEVVAIFQKKSEQGQRGLGNRSLLLDATNPNAFKIMNEIKNRAWFRPFACSILEEHSLEWFGCKSSPYMMYVFKASEKYKNLIKNVLSVNGTSRIQTVNYVNNNNYYNLINAYYKMYNVPLLLNTSLNLPGEPLIETLEDLLYMFKNSKLKWIYLPEIKKLICKQ